MWFFILGCIFANIVLAFNLNNDILSYLLFVHIPLSQVLRLSISLMVGTVSYSSANGIIQGVSIYVHCFGESALSSTISCWISGIVIQTYALSSHWLGSQLLHIPPERLVCPGLFIILLLFRFARQLLDHQSTPVSDCF